MTNCLLTYEHEFKEFAVVDWEDRATVVPSGPGGARPRQGLFLQVDPDEVVAVRVTDGALTPDEVDYADFVLGPAALEVRSGALFVGGANREEHVQDATRISVPWKFCSVTAYRVRWEDSPRWYDEDGEMLDSVPPDLVVHLGQAASTQVEGPARFDRVPSEAPFLFASSRRVIGPRVGSHMRVRVFQGPPGHLSLRPLQPWELYRGRLRGAPDVRWRDRLLVHIVEVDGNKRTFVAELLAVLERRPL